MAFDPLLLRARSLIFAGLYDDAERLYNSLIAERGETVEIMRAVAFLQTKLGNNHRAVKILRKLAQAEPENDEILFDLACSQLSIGQVAAALKSCKQLRLRCRGDEALALKVNRLYAQCLGMVGKRTESAKLLEELLVLAPEDIDLRMDYGNSLYLLGNYAPAINEYATILETDPEHQEAILLTAVAHHDSHNLAQAVEFYSKLKSEGEPVFDVVFRHCNALGDLGRHDESYELLIKLPKKAQRFGQYWLNMGNVMSSRKDSVEAIRCFKRGRRYSANDYVMANNLGLAYAGLGLIEEAIRYLKIAVKNSKNTPAAGAVYSNLLFNYQYSPSLTAKQISRAHWQFDKSIGAPKTLPKSYPNDRSRDRPLRIGYISDDLVNHPVGFFVSSVIIRHNRQAVESFCYSSKGYEDQTTLKIKSNAHHWRKITGLTPPEVKQIVLRDKIDILVDLSGHTSGNHLVMMSEKPVPIQATWAGYVGTTGLQAMDWLIADRFHVPVELESLHRERIWRMPHGYICFEPSTAMVPVGPLPALANGFVTFCSFNNPNKLNDGILTIWAEILAQVPNSQLRLKYGSMGQEFQKQRITRVFTEMGIDPARLIIENGGIAYDLYCAYQQCDIALDTSPYSGGLTTCEALYLGLPVVTFPGERFASRHSFSHISNAGLTETIADSWDQYRNIAVKLAGDLPRLAEIRGSLRAMIAASPLCDADLFVRDLEVGFRHMWLDWLARKA
ncbi:MAG: tetratricopeptide repeat protein [Alphaproteobacteria bacterium]|nr:tetratricopeptide repeat protein [Alphaproteobacteria bacterium]